METNSIQSFRTSDGVHELTFGKIEKSVISSPSKQKIISGWLLVFIHLTVRLHIAHVIAKNYKNLRHVFQIIVAFKALRKKVSGGRKINKIAYVDGKYYWDIYTPGHSSAAFVPFIEGEANRVIPLQKKTNRFTNIFVAFTKKCSLKCEHCFEWGALNKKESLSLSAIQEIIQKFQEKGTAQIQLTGGEPMLRINDILEILNSAKPKTDFWVLTSGYNLTSENAQKLKHAGLTGVVISLDHFDADQHNKFRGFKKSFEWVEAAVKNSIHAGLVTALSICVTKSFVTWPNLLAYIDLAKKMGVSFVQILEPKAVGHYTGMDVQLKKEQEDILHDFFLRINNDKRYSDYPIVTYHGFHQRNAGCFAAGNRNLYVDTDGDLHACPFCHTKMGSALIDLDHSIKNVQNGGCHSFNLFEG